jgi:hypothetical protein
MLYLPFTIPMSIVLTIDIDEIMARNKTYLPERCRRLQSLHIVISFIQYSLNTVFAIIVVHVWNYKEQTTALARHAKGICFSFIYLIFAYYILATS